MIWDSDDVDSLSTEDRINARYRAKYDRLVTYALMIHDDDRLYQLELLLGDASGFSEVGHHPLDPQQFVLSSIRWERIIARGHDSTPGEQFERERRLTGELLMEMYVD